MNGREESIFVSVPTVLGEQVLFRIRVIGIMGVSPALGSVFALAILASSLRASKSGMDDDADVLGDVVVDDVGLHDAMAIS